MDNELKTYILGYAIIIAIFLIRQWFYTRRENRQFKKALAAMAQRHHKQYLRDIEQAIIATAPIMVKLFNTYKSKKDEQGKN